MSIPPAVTCICTAYNVGPYVHDAIASALAHDYEGELEIVAIDDGSTDDTAAVLDTFADRITVVHQANTGFLGAVDAGLAAATGTYVALLDGDDMWPADKVRRQAEFLDANPDVGLVFGDMEVIDERGGHMHDSFWRLENLEVHRGDIFDRLVQGNFVSGGASMFRASFLERVAPIPRTVAWPDWWIAARIAEVARLEWIDGSMNRYRMHGANMTFGADSARLAKNKRDEIRMRRWILANLSNSRAPVSALFMCHQLLELQAAQAAHTLGELPTGGVPVDDLERARAAGARAAAHERLSADDPEGAVRKLLSALGQDPWNGAARVELHWLVDALGGPSALTGTGQGLPDVRGFCAVADGDEISVRPALLRAFADAFSPSDDATLLVLGPDDSAAALQTKMLAALGAAGLDEDACPDVLLLPGVRPEAVVAQAVLSEREGPVALRALPHAGDATGLRELARLAWSA